MIVVVSWDEILCVYVDAAVEQLCHCMQDNTTPLFIASERNNVDAVKKLLAAGANPDVAKNVSALGAQLTWTVQLHYIYCVELVKPSCSLNCPTYMYMYICMHVYVLKDGFGVCATLYMYVHVYIGRKAWICAIHGLHTKRGSVLCATIQGLSSQFTDCIIHSEQSTDLQVIHSCPPWICIAVITIIAQ